MEENQNLANGPGRHSAGGRYDDAERRTSRAVWFGIERRVSDPSTEQDHPEEYEPE